MPYLTVYTNAQIQDNEKIAEEASSLTAEILGKPESYVVVNIIHNKAMSFGGSCNNPGALVELKSIGLGNKNKFVAEITAFLAEKLHITDTHYIAIALSDVSAAYTACAGRTFA